MLRLNPPKRVIIAFIIVLLSGLVPVHGQAIITQLETAKMIDREIKSGESQLYQITLAEGAYLNLTVAYQGVAVDVILKASNGQLFTERRGGVDTLDSTEIAIITPTADTYQLFVNGRGAGKYKLEVKALRIATELDRQYVAAHRLTQEGNALVILRTAESRRQALAKFREALPLWRTSGKLRQELETIRLIADTHYVLSEFRPAMEAAQELLTKARAAGLRFWELKGLKYVGSLQNSLNNQQEARQILEQALTLARELGERLEERAILNNLGVTSSALGQRHTALGYYQQALKLARELGDRTGEAAALRNLAIRYEGIGEPEQALEHYQQAAALRRKLGARDL